VRHVGIVVSDLDRALRFYRDGLGLAVLKAMEEKGPYLDNMLAIPNVRVTTVKLAAETGTALVELLNFHASDRDTEIADHPVDAIGPSHVAFTVSNLDETYEKLTRAGVRFHAPPQLSPDGYAKVTYCRDPDGTPIELVEVLKP
jgi:catechol 2,3-dioxygenase-like lactoylglutathione lyase family enzyme